MRGGQTITRRHFSRSARYDSRMATKKKAKKPASKKPAPKKSAAKKTNKKNASAKKTVTKKAVKKAVKKKSATVKAAPKKIATKAAPVKKAAPAKAKAKAKKPMVRRDATGHLNAEYEHDLRRAGREKDSNPDERAFLVGKNADDALANELGREFVETVNSGEDEGIELRDEFVTEEVGGPFVPSTRGKEIDEEPDESNPISATREPFPKTSS